VLSQNINRCPNYLINRRWQSPKPVTVILIQFGFQKGRKAENFEFESLKNIGTLMKK
jgi:hypothetical protein